MTKLEVGKAYWVKVYKTGSFEIDSFGNRKEAFQSNTGDTFEVYLNSEYVKSECATAIPERKKVTIPKEVAEWLELCKKREYHLSVSLEEGILKEATELTNWLFDRSNQNTFARAWLDGYTVEQPLGVLMIYVDYGAGYNYLATDKANDSYKIGAADTGLEVVSDSKALKVTESEAKEKYPNFKWVSLEELGE